MTYTIWPLLAPLTSPISFFLLLTALLALAPLPFLQSAKNSLAPGVFLYHSLSATLFPRHVVGHALRSLLLCSLFRSPSFANQIKITPTHPSTLI